MFCANVLDLSESEFDEENPTYVNCLPLPAWHVVFMYALEFTKTPQTSLQRVDFAFPFNLFDSDGQLFSPDFSAKVSENARVLRISRATYKAAVQAEIDALQQEQRELVDYNRPSQNATVEVHEQKRKNKHCHFELQSTAFLSLMSRAEYICSPMLMRFIFDARIMIHQT